MLGKILSSQTYFNFFYNNKHTAFGRSNRYESITFAQRLLSMFKLVPATLGLIVGSVMWIKEHTLAKHSTAHKTQKIAQQNIITSSKPTTVDKDLPNVEPSKPKVIIDKVKIVDLYPPEDEKKIDLNLLKDKKRISIEPHLKPANPQFGNEKINLTQAKNEKKADLNPPKDDKDDFSNLDSHLKDLTDLNEDIDDLGQKSLPKIEPIPKDEYYIQPPGMLLCPLTLNLFEDPVITNDGFTYEREAIAAYSNSPITGGPINCLITNYLMRDAVDRFKALRKENKEWENNPDRYNCPLTLEIMQDPVVDEYGHTYEREAINQCAKSPLTKQFYTKNKKLISNLALKLEIEAYKSDQLILINEKEIKLEKVDQTKVNSIVEDNRPLEPLPGFVCPLTKELLEEAVIAEDGYTYSKKAFSNKRILSPKKSNTLIGRHLVKNQRMQQIIDDFKKLRDGLNQISELEKELQKLNEKPKDSLSNAEREKIVFITELQALKQTKKLKIKEEWVVDEISEEILENPVVVEADGGRTHELAIIKELQEDNKTAPQTRASLQNEVFIPNLTLKALIDIYHLENPKQESENKDIDS